jgi:hypothetical protein
MTIDHERRAMLTAKYGIDRRPMDLALGATVQAIRRPVREGLAVLMAETDFRVSIMEAQLTLPVGARIDPGSPVAPTA